MEGRNQRGSKLYKDQPTSNKKYPNLDRQELEYFAAAFKRIDYNKTGTIQFSELMTLVEARFKIDSRLKEKMFKELEDQSIKVLNLEAVYIIASMLKEDLSNRNNHDTTQHSNEYIDAFVALGGEADQSGFVSRQKILDIIMNEFELTFDMAQFLEKIEVQEEQLDYKTFCQVFEQEERAMSRAGSVLSIISSRSRKSVVNVNTSKNNDSFKTLKVKYRDFEKFEAEYQQREQDKLQQLQNQQEQDEHSPTSPQSPDKLY